MKVPHRITIFQSGHKYAEMKLADFKVNSGTRIEDIQKRP